MVSSLSPTQWLLISCTILGLSACQKEKDPIDTLPEATQIGANTMGCLIDGKAFQPKSIGLFSPESMGGYRFPNGETTLYFYRREYPDGENHPTLDLHLELPRVRGLGSYSVNQASQPGSQQVACARYRFTPARRNQGTPTTREYRTSALATGQVLITRFDSVANIISGTFEFTAQEVNGTGTVRVTEGRFDLPYNR